MTPQEKSKIIFEALKLGPCWHEAESESFPLPIGTIWRCRKCLVGEEVNSFGITQQNPNYFDPKLPDSERVKLVEAAHLLYSYKFDEALRNGAGSFFGVSTTIALLPGAAIAEAIYRLITEGEMAHRPKCEKCDTAAYSFGYDSWFCPNCKIWLEEDCRCEDCEFSGRPETLEGEIL